MIFYVYMHNATDSRDDEVYKVQAKDPEDAKTVARSKMEWAGRFSVGWAMPGRPKTKKDREFLKSYRWWATNKVK